MSADAGRSEGFPISGVDREAPGFVPDYTHLPCDAVFAVGLSGVDDGVLIVAGALLPRHTQPVVVHVGSFGAATAVHRAEADLASVVRLAEGVAGAATGGHVVAVHRV